MADDRYADLRAALADAQSADGDWVVPVIEVDTIRALLAERDGAEQKSLDRGMTILTLQRIARELEVERDKLRDALTQAKTWISRDEHGDECRGGPFCCCGKYDLEKAMDAALAQEGS